MQKNLILSMIIPVYNNGDTVERAVRSLTSGGGLKSEEIEIIIVDDGSDKIDADIWDALSAYPSVAVYHKQNGGVASARNYALDIARGKYIMFCDADDESGECTPRDLVEHAERYGSDMVVCGYDWVISGEDGVSQKVLSVLFEEKCFDGEYVRRHFDRFFDRDGDEMFISGYIHNKLFRSEIIKNNNIRFPRLKRYEDEVFVYTCLSYARRVSFCPGSCYRYYISDVNSMRQKYGSSYFEDLKVSLGCLTGTVMGWNSENTALLEKICRKFAVGVDLYVGMVAADESLGFRQKIKRIGGALDFFDRNIPSRSFTPDFLKYKIMLRRGAAAPYLLYAIHKIKE